MPCPVCQHTLHGVSGTPTTTKTWWCPRCGTIVTDQPNGDRSFDVPRWTALLSCDRHKEADRESRGAGVMKVDPAKPQFFNPAELPAQQVVNGVTLYLAWKDGRPHYVSVPEDR
jgi:hypothetical protein